MDLIGVSVGGGQTGLVLIALYACLSVGLSFALQGLVNRLWRAGVDSQRNLGGVVVLVKMFFMLGFGALLAARAVQEFVHGNVFSAVVTLLLFLLGVLSIGRDVVGCAVLTFATKVRIGDRMQVQGLSGTVRQIGLVQTTLRDAAGTKLVLPNREFLARPLSIAKTKHSVPLSIRFPIEKLERSAQVLQRVRVLSLLCPFRAAHSTVLVHWRDNQLVVELDVWSPAALHHAEEHLDAVIRSVLTEEGKAGPKSGATQS